MVSVNPRHVFGSGVNIVCRGLRKIRSGPELQVQVNETQVRKLIESREGLITHGLALVKTLVTQTKFVGERGTKSVILGHRQRIRARWHRSVEGRKIGSSVDRIKPIVDKPSP